MASHLRLFSDIHLDFDIGNMTYLHPRQVWTPAPLPEDADSILLLAGDLWRNNLTFKVMPDGDSWISWVAKRFEHIVLVLGNHDYWGLSLQSAVRKAQAAIELLPNVTLLEKSTATISGIKFVGGTLWTDYGRDPIAMVTGRNEMADFKFMTFGDTNARRKITPNDLLEVHRQTARFIFNNCKADVPDQPVIIMTHMAPNEQSIDPDYAHERLLNASYFTDLSKSVATHCSDVKLWVHGHIHRPVDYMFYNVRVLSNPRGYEASSYHNRFAYEPNHLLRIDSL